MRLLLPALMALLALPAPAAAQGVKRCTDAQGNTVFTDRPCASVDAVPKGAPAPAPGSYSPGFAPRGCARTADALLLGVRTSLEARDVNRLASYYHWAGTGTRGARQVMDELEAIAHRPLVAVSLAYPAEAVLADPLLAFGPGSGSEPDPASGLPNPAPERSRGAGPVSQTDTASMATGSEPDPVPAPAPGPRPVGLDVEQMAGAADAGSRSTRFRLQRHVGCWWLEL
ncbi:DUF4124 domain-containing protein [Arenimonas metalli]|uniref:DUF4124 domain-containing protein n=1 Tax=Arenimonas metalli CF5-1 TaxID=1384056 RepID=A0A091ARS1_9GAMM|nr:DUF4124 domain-containing protein [Arenimonas metalli]KFN42046.1 hypothetical protein N787_04565 [Arenimonas metalli CF5-1]